MEPQDSIFQFLMPMNLAFFAGIFLLGYLRNREMRFTGYVAAGYAVASLTTMLEIYNQSHPVARIYNTDIETLGYCLPGLLLAMAFAERYQQPKPWRLIAILTLLGVIIQIYFGHYAVNSQLRTMLIDWVAGSFMALSLLAIPLRNGRFIDRVLFWLFTGISLTYAVRIMLSLALFGDNYAWNEAAQAIYVTSLFFATTMISMSAGVAMLVLAAFDILDKYRLETMTDPLTGLMNRRGFQQSMDALNDAAANADAPLRAIVALDLDRFKQINDRYGHDTGDAVLRRVGATIGKISADYGEAARIGGEEFIVVLNAKTSKARQMFAQHLHMTLHFLVHPELPENEFVTVSIGIALARKHEAAQSVLSRADQALYEAKSRGRDRVIDADADLAGSDFASPDLTVPSPKSVTVQ